MSCLIVKPVSTLEGELTLPGDKSISHRAIIFCALADGVSHLHNVNTGDDVQSTINCMRALGVRIDQVGAKVSVHGVGLHGLQAPAAPLDCGNSGTTMRLLAGVLAAQPFASELVGDASLSRRPMQRVVEPLRAMGASIAAAEGHAPLQIKPVKQLQAVPISLDTASAQVQSAVQLAQLYTLGSAPIEVGQCRDHTTRWLQASSGRLTAQNIKIPGDFSSASFLLIASMLAKQSNVTLRNVGVNPSRTGLLDILAQAGAMVTLSHAHQAGSEPVADLSVMPAHITHIKGIRVTGGHGYLIDELPLVALLGALAQGETQVSGAGELRHKECDRIHAMAMNLQALGATIVETPDGWHIQGKPRLSGGVVDSFGDHRIAMAMTVAATRADAPIIIRNAECIAVSFPQFIEHIQQLGIECYVDHSSHYN